MHHIRIISNKAYALNNVLRIVIAFSLYGNASRYLPGLYKNCKVISETYPSFFIYVYVGNDFDHSILTILNEFKNIKIIQTGKSGHINMCYRFIPIDDDDVGISFSRDADSLVNKRDMYCINSFIKSNKKFLIIRDHPAHGTEILGGMWGIKKGLLNFNMKNEINDFFKNTVNKHGDDQNFLSNKIYHLVKNSSLIFDEFCNYPGETKEKIITSEPWTTLNHVGACVNLI
jgi:hypothetical protein